MRAVLDSNILISGLLFEGNERKLLALALDEKITIVTSEYIIAETTRILASKFSDDPRTNPATEMLKTITANAEVFSDENNPAYETTKALIRDEKDAPVLALAIASKPDVLITGDTDFFELREKMPFLILTATQFLQRIT